MMCRADQQPDPQDADRAADAAFAALLEDSAEDLY
jgi:sigma-B regulation protein RsbU (phosphoserine phosphatase)